MKIKKNKGILFFITGLSGSGKSALANRIKKNIQIKYGTTLVLHGDDIRKIFSLKKYSMKEREKIALQYCRLCKKITDSKINVILATVSLFSSVRRWNRKNFKNYIEIYIKTSLEEVIKKKKKFFYKKKSKNVVGLSIRPEYPTNPHIIINNDFKSNLNYLSNKLNWDINNLFKSKKIFKS